MPSSAWLLLLPIAGLAGSAPAQMSDTDLWARRAEAAQQALAEHFYNARTGLCELACPADPREQRWHYWWQAQAIDVFVDGFERSGDRACLDRAAAVWAAVERRNGGITNDYFDDMLWMALALHRLQAHTKDAGQRGDVQTLWREVQRGWNEQQGGGIAWRRSQRDYKNTPANAPAVILGVRLHRAYGKAADLAFAQRVHAWLDATLVDPDTGFVWDGVNRNGDGRTDKDWAFTYNQGVRIGAAVELFASTREPRHLQSAVRTFDAAVARLTDEHGVLRERGKGDAGLFKGIFVRYLGALVATDPAAHAKVAAFLRRQADSVWAQLAPAGKPTEPLLFPAVWNRPAVGAVELSAQLSGIMLFEQMAKLERAAATR